MPTNNFENIDMVVKKLIAAEDKGWGNIDEQMIYLEALLDDELCNEALILFAEHAAGHIRPDFDLPNKHLLTGMLLQAIETITFLYQKTGIMGESHKYVLQQYLALHHMSKLNINKKL